MLRITKKKELVTMLRVTKKKELVTMLRVVTKMPPLRGAYKTGNLWEQEQNSYYKRVRN